MDDIRIFVSLDTAMPSTGPTVLVVSDRWSAALDERLIAALAEALLDEKEKAKRIQARVGALRAAMRVRVAEAKALAAAAEQKAQARKRSANTYLQLLEEGFARHPFRTHGGFLCALLFRGVPPALRHAFTSVGIQLSRAISEGVAPPAVPRHTLSEVASDALATRALYKPWSEPHEILLPEYLSFKGNSLSGLVFSTEADFLGFHDAIVAFADADRTDD